MEDINMYRTLDKPKEYSDYHGYLSDHPGTVSEIKTVSSRFEIVAKIISKDKTYDGVIDNVYNDGAEYLLTYLINSEDFKPEKRMMLNLQIPSGEILCIKCDVKWFLKTSDDNKKLILGMISLRSYQIYSLLNLIRIDMRKII